MIKYGVCQLTVRDFVLLQNLVRSKQIGDSCVQEELSSKLSSAVVLAPAEVAPQVVTLDSRVCFRCDRQQPESRVVCLRDEAYPIGAALSITTPLGLKLLGRRSGDRFTVEGCKGKAMQVEIIAVTYQPETAGRRLQSA